MFPFAAQYILPKLPVVPPGMTDFKILIKLRHEIVMKVFRYTPAVVPAISHNYSFFGHDPNAGAHEEPVKQNI